ncbi:MAG: acetate--CoA ligase family protein [Candidatus Pacebacteria bacterium]|nr:acetate--CoA ligase family protein [Candidatus Paceibacterota bacterium]
MPENKLDKFFTPKSVAVIGASTDKGKIGYGILKNILEAKYRGTVYPINLKAKKILGLKAYPSVLSVEKEIDLAVIAIPAKFVSAALEECGEKGIKNTIIISAGFKETGKEGTKMEAGVIRIAAKYDMKIIGPNCLGLADSTSNLNASFANGMIQKGSLGFISQSGAICSAMLDWANLNGVGFSRFVSVGNKAVISEVELMKYFKDDDKTTAVLAYLESIKDGKAFMEAAAELILKKPLVIIKPGISKASQKAMQSHTGALAGTDAAIRTAFSEVGAVRVDNMEQLFDVAKFLSRYDKIKSNSVAIITNAGGPGVIGTDEIEKHGLKLAKLSRKTEVALKSILPTEANFHNPVDVLGDAKEDRYKFALKALLEDKNVDAIIFILTPQRGTEIGKTAKTLIELSKKSDKPVVTSFIGGKLMEKEIALLKESLIASYDHLSQAIFSLGKVWECEKGKKEAREYLNFYKGALSETIGETIKQAPDFIQSLELLEKYGIPVAQSKVAYTSEEAATIAHEIGYPVAMKIFSKKISHKTEVEGVKIGIKNDLEIREYFDRIKSTLGEDLDGMIVQPMAKGREIILGIKKDESFGSMIMFGLGGVYTEVLKDVAFRFAPIDKDEAMQMMQEIKTFKTLTGYREFPKMDIESVAEAIVSLSRLADEHPEIKELDINPLIVRQEGEKCSAVDVRILI